jgi:Periplasmic copper-binding protein (NosD)
MSPMSPILRFTRSLSFVVAVGLFTVVVLVAPSETAGATIVVGQNAAVCPGAQFAKIQDAVNAASPGDTIQICPGVYAEQVSISKALQVNANNGAILRPSGAAANTTGLASGQPIAALLLIENTTDVTVRNLTVDGTDADINACVPDLIGVFFRNASGQLSHVAVRNAKLSSNFSGCQSGSAILVQSGGGQQSVVGIAESSIHAYQKNGITANEGGTDVTIEGNVVTGLGPTTGAAQNGIQIGFGAAGTIRHNTVANHIWSPCVSADECKATANDILVFQSDGVSVHDNVVGVSQTGVAIVGDNANVFDNDIFDSQIFDGIELIGDNNTAQRNQITHSDQAGVMIAGSSNVVRNNVINESVIGVLKLSGSTGNTIANNTYFNSPAKLQDPPAGALKASPYR